MRIIYIAGPFSAPTRAGVDAHILSAIGVALQVAALGACPLCPHANTSDPRFEAIQPYQFWIEATLELLRRSDAVMLAPGWDNSKGAIGEVREAEILRLPVFQTITALERWLRDDRGELPTLPDAIAQLGRLVGADRNG